MSTSNEAKPAVAADDDFSKKTVADVLGQIVWLMTQSKEHRGLFLSDLEWAIMPPILSKQFKLYYHEGQPKGAVFWAMVDEETKERLDGTANIHQALWGPEVKDIDEAMNYANKLILKSHPIS